MKDERIQTTINHITRRAFVIYFVLMCISLNYRLWILKQHPREFWDFMAIFFIVSFYVSIAFANKGVFDHNFKRYWLGIGIGVIVVNTALFFIKGQINSIADGGMYLGGILLGMGSVIAIAYFLNRRWKRKEGIQDEK